MGNCENRRLDPVLDAVLSQDMQRLENCLIAGGDVNAEEGGTPAIVFAASLGEPRLVELLIKHGADVNRKGNGNATALAAAAYVASSPSVIAALLRAGAKINDRNDIGQTALMSAAKGGHLATMKLIVAHGADPKTKDDGGRTALHWASTNGDFPEVARFLIELGLDPTEKASEGGSAIDYARALKRTEMLRAMESAALGGG